jgi:hypothetical protein
MSKTLYQITKDFLKIPQNERSVELWNKLREDLKIIHPTKIINELDTSGFIISWLHE